jgi:hypothetical protein
VPEVPLDPLIPLVPEDPDVPLDPVDPPPPLLLRTKSPSAIPP